MDVVPLGILTVESGHPAKAQSPINLTFDPMLTVVREVDAKNELFPIIVTLGGILAVVSAVHCANARGPIVVTPFGMLA